MQPCATSTLPRLRSIRNPSRDPRRAWRGRTGCFTILGTLRGSDGNIAPLETVACANPQLLIRAFGAAGPGGWFAAGIIERDDD